MFQAILVVHILIAMALVVLVLLNQGKGADMGPAFGSGASSTVFGSRGSASFLTKIITLLGTAFFATSLSLAVIAARGVGEPTTVVAEDPEEEIPAAPAVEVPDDAPAVPDDAPAAPEDPDAPPADGPVAPPPPAE